MNQLKENLIMWIFSSLTETRKYYILRQAQENIKNSTPEINITFVEVNK
jgi:hypothetical protein